MIGRVWCGCLAIGAVVMACNALTGIGDLGVDGASDASADATPIVEASPTATATTTSTAPPPQPEAGPADAAPDADGAIVDSGPPPPPPNIGTFNGHRYEVVLSGDALAWDDANDAAKAKGGHLVTLTSKAETDFVANLVSTNNAAPGGYGPWYGATKPQVDPDADGGPAPPDANWSWITGEAWSYTDWLDGQPDNQDLNENFLGGLNGGWNDYRIAGDGEVFSYVIEYEHL